MLVKILSWSRELAIWLISQCSYQELMRSPKVTLIRRDYSQNALGLFS